jgi:hypothetical protein
MSYVEKGLKAPLTGYVFQEVPGDYQITDNDIGSIMRLYQKRKDIYYGKYTWDPEGAKNYFLKNVAPFLLDEMWDKVIDQGHQPLYAKLNVLEVSNYTADQYYYTYEVDIYFIVKHASIPAIVWTLIKLAEYIILAVVIGWIIQQCIILAQTFGKAIQNVIYVVQNFLQPFIPWIILLIAVYIMGKIMELARG